MEDVFLIALKAVHAVQRSVILGTFLPRSTLKETPIIRSGIYRADIEAHYEQLSGAWERHFRP